LGNLISSIGEFGLIEKIKRQLGSKIIGDDTAPIVIGGEIYLATCDILLEDQHFLRSYPPEKIGFKAISVNVSDIVASGGKPIWVLVSLLLPDINISYVNKIYEGIKKACLYYHCQVIGGNITSSEKIGIDVFMIGKAKKFMGRSGAKIDDLVYTTGVLGDSKAGLELLLKKKKSYENFEKQLIKKHINPIINIKNSDYISSFATSALDISDGLSSDIFYLSNQSNVGIVIESKKIPLSDSLLRFCKKYNYDPIDYSLSGGEDYEVLFTQNLKSLPAQAGEIRNPKKYFCIGKVVPKRGVWLDDKKLINKSFSHFLPVTKPPK